jgi:hypothetical protein
MNPTELVERVIELGHERLSETLKLLHPDAVWVLDGGRPPLRGHDQIARFVAEELERLRPDVPEPITSSLTQHGNVVLVNGQLKVPHTGGRDRARHAAHPASQPVAATSARAGVAAASRPPAAPEPRRRR